MKWIDARKQRPTKDAVVWAMNAHGWMMAPIRCNYHKSADCFVAYDTNRYNAYTIDVTHYIEEPAWPLEKTQDEVD